jgi:LacI family transcriptional regulator
MARRPVTLREVASNANVSVATVSYVLAGKGRMADETRRRVEGLLRDAGLRPRYKRYPVVYLSDHREFGDMQAFNPFLQMYNGLNGGFHQADITLRTEFLHMPGVGDLQSQLHQLMTYRVGAAILDSNLREDLGEIGKFFAERKIPTIQVGHTLRSPAVDAVVVDNFGGAYKAVKYFVDKGHQRIATIRWNVAGDPASIKKYAGYTCALDEAGIAVRPEYVVESPFTKQDGRLPGRVAVEQLLALPNPPTAVFIENSFISPSLIYTISPHEQQLPRAIAELDMIHFEAWHLEWLEQVMAGKLCYPDRRTKLMRINWEEIGWTAAKRLVARMEGLDASPEVIQFVPKLVEIQGYDATPLDEGH